jgi:hypothetical protein
MPSVEWPMFPICVATPASFASLATSRFSHTLCVSGFSQYRCLPARSACTDTHACRWSGVAHSTASTCFSFSSSTRTSSYAAQRNFASVGWYSFSISAATGPRPARPL